MSGVAIMKNTIRFWFGILTALFLLASLPATAAVEAGKVLAVVGTVSAAQAGDSSRSLSNGSLVYSGDLISTQSNSRIQIRYTDGALVSLPGDSQYRIDDYVYTPGELGFFSLLKGGLRTLSGLIGKTTQSEYRVSTPVATIGIRGTDYALHLCQNDCRAGLENGLYLSVFEGAIVATNEAGEYLLKAGESAFIPNARTPAQRRKDTTFEFGELLPWHGSGGGGGSPGPIRGDVGVGAGLDVEFRATDLIRCNR